MAKTKKGPEAPEPPKETDPHKLNHEGLGLRLMAYARRRARRYAWSHGPKLLTKGHQLEDLVQDAIMKLFTKWNADKYPDPWPFLVLELRTGISNLARSVYNRRTDRI